MQKTSFNFKIATIVLSMLMIISIGASTMLMPNVNAHTPPYQIPTLAFINVAPNPIGLGQSATVDFWLAVPLQTSERAVNMTVYQIDPDGVKTSLGNGNITSDITGGTTVIVTPSKIGNYTYQFFYGGQVLLSGSATTGYNTDVELPSVSNIVTLTVQEEPIIGIPFTPLPTQWWQTPINAENVQNWYAISGPWLGLASAPFGGTGQYNASGNFNPYTLAPMSGHIIWTKPWAVGGVAGGDAGPSEQAGSFWGTSQYEPKWNPVVMDGIEWATQYTTTTGYNNGIVATNLFTGETLYRINTTNALKCGYMPNYETPNQYGVVGPYILTTGTLPLSDTGGIIINNTGTQWNLYDALTGKYVRSVVNGTSPSYLAVDANGNLLGYYLNSTYGTEMVHPPTGPAVKVTTTAVNGPALTAWNLTLALGVGNSQWSMSLNSVSNFSNGIMWAVQTVPLNISGVAITPTLSFGGLGSGQIASNVIVMYAGTGVGSVGETAGYTTQAGFDQNTGALLWVANRTELPTYTPYTRLSENFYGLAGNDMYIDLNENTFTGVAYNIHTGAVIWRTTLTINGSEPNTYDEYGIQTIIGNGVIYFWGLGGDVWAVNSSTGKTMWTYSTGGSTYETPYGIWPLWVQYGGVLGGGMLYLSEGHEYSPPLFHGAQVIALNATDGRLVWTELGFDDTGGALVDGIYTSFNSYDNQVYAYGQGPSKTTVTAPDTAATVGVPVVIRGRVTDVSPGTMQSAVALNFPNGVPAVSDASESHWMEYVYMQQVYPTGTTGVPVTISVIDSNNNFRSIGTTTSDASGTFSLTWAPDIPGNYTVIANFAGSNAYYGSSAETAVYAMLPASSPTPTATTATNLATDTYVLTIGIAIIVVIIIIGAVLAVLMMRKRA